MKGISYFEKVAGPQKFFYRTSVEGCMRVEDVTCFFPAPISVESSLLFQNCTHCLFPTGLCPGYRVAYHFDPALPAQESRNAADCLTFSGTLHFYFPGCSLNDRLHSSNPASF